MIIVYNNNSFEEVFCNKPPVHIGKCIDDVKAKIELANRELPEGEKYEVYEGEVFPPSGKIFEVGVGLRDKTEKEKVESGEIQLSNIKQQIFEKINKLCYAAIVSGFKSDALGEVHVYDSEDIDQLNLIGAVASGSDVYYKCSRESDGLRDFFLHTNTQIKEVLSDAANRKISLLQRCYHLKTQIELLNNYEAVISFDILQGWE